MDILRAGDGDLLYKTHTVVDIIHPDLFFVRPARGIEQPRIAINGEPRDAVAVKLVRQVVYLACRLKGIAVKNDYARLALAAALDGG